jgi:hypothetical protein
MDNYHILEKYLHPVKREGQLDRMLESSSAFTYPTWPGESASSFPPWPGEFQPCPKVQISQDVFSTYPDFNQVQAKAESEFHAFKKALDGVFSLEARHDQTARKYGAIKYKMQKYIAAVLRWTHDHVHSDLRSVETGLAVGGSAMAIMGTAVAYDIPTHHTAIDPAQFTDVFKGSGYKSMVHFLGNDLKNGTKEFTMVTETAAIGLAKMYQDGVCLTFAFLDDGHKFDDNMVEFYFVNKMLRVGGTVMFDDIWMSSVRATASYVETNFPRMYKRINTERFATFVKISEDARRWDEFEHFETFESQGHVDQSKPRKKKKR